MANGRGRDYQQSGLGGLPNVDAGVFNDEPMRREASIDSNSASSLSDFLVSFDPPSNGYRAMKAVENVKGILAWGLLPFSTCGTLILFFLSFNFNYFPTYVYSYTFVRLFQSNGFYTAVVGATKYDSNFTLSDIPASFYTFAAVFLIFLSFILNLVSPLMIKKNVYGFRVLKTIIISFNIFTDLPGAKFMVNQMDVYGYFLNMTGLPLFASISWFLSIMAFLFVCSIMFEYVMFILGCVSIQLWQNRNLPLTREI